MPRGPAARRQLAPAAARRAAPSHLAQARRQMLTWQRQSWPLGSRRRQGMMHQERMPPGAGSARAAPRQLLTIRLAPRVPLARPVQTCRVRLQMLPGWPGSSQPSSLPAISALQLPCSPAKPVHQFSQPSQLSGLHRPPALPSALLQLLCARHHWCILYCPATRPINPPPPPSPPPSPACRWPNRRGQRGVMPWLKIPVAGRHSHMYLSAMSPGEMPSPTSCTAP
jgi:hypothetical protein